MPSQSEAIRFARIHTESTTLLPNGKLQFTNTGMEFPSNVSHATLKSYVTGKAYRRALTRKIDNVYDFDQHLPYIVPHKQRNENHFLFCTLTFKTLPRHGEVLIKHTNGKRFKRCLKSLLAKQEQKEAAQKKKAERKKQRIAKQSDLEDDEQIQNVQHVQEVPDIEMKDPPDVLTGILSSDDDSAKMSEEEGDHQNHYAPQQDKSQPKQAAISARSNRKRTKTKQKSKQAESEKDGETQRKPDVKPRRRKKGAKSEQDDETRKKPDLKLRKRSKAAKSEENSETRRTPDLKLREKKQINVAHTSNSSSPITSVAEKRVSKKRRRSSMSVPKKVKPVRQRSKIETVAT